MARALVPLADGFEDVEAITIIDVLRRGGIDVVTASISGTRDVRSAHGVLMKADAVFEEAEGASYEAIILPGGGEGTENLKASTPLIHRLHRQRAENGYLCAICAAPTVLEFAGVLDDGVQVTCYPSCQMDLNRPWMPAPVVSDGRVITGQAPGSALLFSLVVLQELTGIQVARRVARGMVTDVLD